MRNNLWVPLCKEDGKIVIAIDNPHDLQKVGEVMSLFTGQSLLFNVALKQDILDFIKLFTRDEIKLASRQDILSQLQSEEEEIEETDKDHELYEKLRQPISELELSVRSANCLEEAKIKIIGDLVQKTEMEMLKYRNFGKKSLAEINNILVSMGLSLGLKIDTKKLKKKQ